MKYQTESQSLKKSATSAVSWNFVETLLRQGVQFGLSVWLARILAPEDFGLMAIALVAVAIGNSLVESGFSQALIQKKVVSSGELSSVFILNLFIALCVSVTSVVLAQPVAGFFGMAQLGPLIQFLALGFLVTGAGSVPVAMLTRECRFKHLAYISGAASLLSACAAVIFAIAGWGVWSLAIQSVLAALVTTALSWRFSGWRPTMRFEPTGLRELFRFGGHIAAVHILETAFGRLNTLAIGKLYSAVELGYYARAESTRAFPSFFGASILNKSVFPLLSRLNHDRDKLSEGYFRALEAVVFVNTPVMVALAVSANMVVSLLFGQRWEPAGPYLQALAVAGVFWMPHLVNMDVLKAAGLSRVFLRIEVVKKMLLIAAVVLTSIISVLAMAWGQVAVNAIAFAYGLVSCLLQLHFPGTLVWRAVWRTLVATGAMCAVTGGVHMLFKEVGHFEEAAGVVFGLAAYWCVSFLLKIRTAFEVVAFLKQIGYRLTLRGGMKPTL